MTSTVIKSINGKELPVQPLTDGFSVTKSDLISGGSGRSAETGKALRYPVRLGTYKLSLKFKGSTEKIAAVDKLVSSFEQEVVFLDGTEYVTANMYPGDRNIKNNGFVSELSVNLIEI